MKFIKTYKNSAFRRYASQNNFHHMSICLRLFCSHALNCICFSKFNLKNQERGFTILETVIYIGLFSILMTGVLVTVYELIEGGTQNREAVAIQSEGTFINRKISWALSGATAIDVSSSTILTITRPDLGGQSPLRITENGGQMLISRGGGATIPLTTAEFKVENTSFSMIPSVAGLPDGILVHYTIDDVPFEFRTYLRF